MGHASAAVGSSSSGAKTAGNTGRGAPENFQSLELSNFKRVRRKHENEYFDSSWGSAALLGLVLLAGCGKKESAKSNPRLLALRRRGRCRSD